MGAPPGYVGYDEGGQLTEAVRRKSYCAILLDEIEKAHPDAFNMLLQILEDGYLTDAKGRRVDFRNTILIMTSNVGADILRRNTALGFIPHGEDEKSMEQQYKEMKGKVLKELKNTFRPEFLNRLDGSIVFRALTRDELREIVDLQLKPIRSSLDAKGIRLEITDDAKDLLVEKGYDKEYGARPLRRVIQNMIEDQLSEAILEGKYESGDMARADRKGDEIIIEREAAKPAEVEEEPRELAETAAD